ncbi:MAG TPA: tail fiber domain-containing protein, partial [Blastocatellia bacterium]|nr:tail fiber domain-containing protein [Blastocatellia bacterium]
GTISATAFSGSGLNLTSLNASNLTSGTLSDSRLSSNVALLNTANTFTANQTVNANLIQSGSLVQFTPTNGLVASGTVGSGSIPATGAGARMMWYPNKAAFRAGQVTGTQWDDSSVGTGSAALGKNNTAGGDNAFAAGESATAGGERSFSFNGTASGVGAIALGSSAQATNDDALALGSSSRAQGLLSTAIGPCLASGSFATCIGLRTNATGNFSLVLGRDASSSSDSTNATTYSGVIALGDGSTTAPSHTMYATANNQFNVRAAGGIRFFSACCNYDTGVTISAGGGAWNSISDRNLKENFQPIAPREILRGVLGLPISTWNYKSQDRSIRHIGAMAQDFFATFKVGENDRTITTIDPDGVALAAIQGLHEELKDRDARIGLQQQQLEKLQEQVQQQQAVIDGLKQLLCAQKTQAAVCRQKQPKQ